MHRLNASLFFTCVLLIIATCLIVIANNFSSGTDFEAYSSYLRKSHDFSSPFSPFLFKSNEIGWSILVFLGNMISPNNAGMTLLFGKIVVIFSFFASCFLVSSSSFYVDSRFSSATFIFTFAAVYFATDIFYLGLSNTIRTGASLPFYALSLCTIILKSNAKDSLSKRKLNTLAFVFIIISISFHSAAVLIYVLLFIFYLETELLSRIGLFAKSRGLFSFFLFIFVFLTIFIPTKMGIFTLLTEYGQSSSSSLGPFKFIFDSLVSFALLIYYCKRNYGYFFLLLTTFCLALSAIGIVYYDIESFNRFEQYIRLTCIVLGVYFSLSICRQKKFQALALSSTILIFTLSNSSVLLNLGLR